MNIPLYSISGKFEVPYPGPPQTPQVSQVSTGVLQLPGVLVHGNPKSSNPPEQSYNISTPPPQTLHASRFTSLHPQAQVLQLPPHVPQASLVEPPPHEASNSAISSGPGNK